MKNTMPPNPNIQTGAIGGENDPLVIRENARQEVINEINNPAKTQQEKHTFLRSIIERFINRKPMYEEFKSQLPWTGMQGTEPITNIFLQDTAKLFEIIHQIKTNPSLDRSQIPIPPGSFRFLAKLEENLSGKLSNRSATLLFPLINYAVYGDINLNGLESHVNGIRNSLRQFGSEIVNEAVSRILIGEAQSLDPSLSQEEAKRRFTLEAETSAEPHDMRRNNEYNALLNKFHGKEDVEFVEALFIKEKFEKFITNEYHNFEREFNSNPNKPVDPQNVLKNQEFSSYFKDKLALLLGKIYQAVDESEPGGFFEEEERKGGIFRSPEVLKEFLLERLFAMRDIDFSDSDLNKMTWFIERHPTFEQLVPVDSEDKSKVELKRFARPLHEYEPAANFREYIIAIRNMIPAEINTRRTFHNVRALPHNPAGKDGYWATLKSYLAKNMLNTDIDDIFHLADSNQILTASRLEDKFMEADFASFNWQHQPAYGQINESTQLSHLDEEVLRYLKTIHKKDYKDEKEEWRAKRALIMGIGDMYSVSLRAIELGALAEPPKLKGKSPNYASYGSKDAAIYRVFNLFAHDNLRFSSEELLMGNLLFLPIEGKNLQEPLNAWNHKKLMEDMHKSIQELVDGKTTQDAKNGTIRFINFLNPGKVGSIYSRSGWRTYSSYESYLVPPGSWKNMKVFESWKALENIGIEVLKDFVGQIPEGFYKSEKKSDRKQLVEYIYKKYFNKKASDIDIENTFNRLERANEIDKAYGDFYYKVLSRAIRQRIPTKFLRMERTKDISGRDRAWTEVLKNIDTNSLDTHTLFHTENLESKEDRKAYLYKIAVKDIAACEAMLREEVTEEMKKEMEQEKKLPHQINLGDKYNLTKDRLSGFLNKLKEAQVSSAKDQNTENEYWDARIKNALTVYDELQNFLDRAEGGKYLDNFAEKYQKPGFPFAIAVEELARDLIAHRAAGENTIVRAVSEIDLTEKNVTDTLSKFFQQLKTASIDGKKDFSEIVKSIATARQQVDSMHGHVPANRLAHHMAALAINYFKKDTMAKAFLGVLRTGQKNSLAAEFAGRSSAVWEWDSRDVDKFCVALETVRALPRDPFEIHKDKEYESHIQKIPFLKNDLIVKLFGREIPILKKEIKFPASIKLFGLEIPLFRQKKKMFDYSSKTLRDEFGGNYFHVIVDMLNKYLPIFLLFILYKFISEGLSEFEGEKK